MPTTLTPAPPVAPDPGTLSGPDAPLFDELERAVLRAEFDALVAASLLPAADAPRPRPPVRRVGTVAPTCAHHGRCTTVVGGPRRGRRRAPGDPSPRPRERGPPAAG